jgi:hypothetical protein
LGESYGLAKPFFAAEDVPPERCRHFDFMIGSDGVDRRHGRFDTESRLVVQNRNNLFLRFIVRPSYGAGL